jgi:3-oxoacyl-[acyl-carrier-protein] synthase III
LKAYITQVAGFLPNAPVQNDDIEKVLGQVGARPSRTRRLVLDSNGIKSRHYAIDPATGASTHTNAQLAAEAVKKLQQQTGLDLVSELGLLSCGSTSADQMIPSHGSMVHGELGAAPCEVASMAGACCTGTTALKYATLAVKSGEHKRAVVTASELFSPLLRAKHFAPELAERVAALENNPSLAFEHDFLRWMLSDGAAAMLIEPEPVQRGNLPPLRIDWLESLSFAGETDVCMYHLGSRSKKDGTLTSWKSVPDSAEWLRGGFFNIGQDARLLSEHIGLVMKKGLEAALKKHPMRAEEIDWLISHHSSNFFRAEVLKRINEANLPIPSERLFTTLSEQGNIGSAGAFLSLEALASQGLLKSGQKVLLFVPESARFSFALAHLTVV